MKLSQEYQSPFKKTSEEGETRSSSTSSSYAESVETQASESYYSGTIRRRAYDIISATTVFILASITLFASFSIDPNNPAVFESFGDRYLVSILPFCTSLGWFVMGLFFLIKAFRYKSCIYAKITSISFFAANLMTLVQAIFGFNWLVYSTIWDFVMIVGVVLTSVVWFIKSLIKKE